MSKANSNHVQFLLNQGAANAVIKCFTRALKEGKATLCHEDDIFSSKYINYVGDFCYNNNIDYDLLYIDNHFVLFLNDVEPQTITHYKDLEHGQRYIVTDSEGCERELIFLVARVSEDLHGDIELYFDTLDGLTTTYTRDEFKKAITV